MVSMSAAVRRIPRRHPASSVTPKRRRGLSLHPLDATAARHQAIPTPAPILTFALLTSALDRQAHDIAVEQWAQGSHSGQFVAKCGVEAVAASLHDRPGPRCPRCVAIAEPPVSVQATARWPVGWLRARLIEEERAAERAGWEVTTGRWGSRTYRDPRFDRLPAAAGAEGAEVR